MMAPSPQSLCYIWNRPVPSVHRRQACEAPLCLAEGAVCQDTAGAALSCPVLDAELEQSCTAQQQELSAGTQQEQWESLSPWGR